MLDASLPVFAGQVLWLDAADATTILDVDGDDAATGTGGNNDGFSGAVATWKDKSVSGFDVTASGSSQPLYGVQTLNGLDTITFDGIDDRITDDFAAITGSGVTAFVVYSRDTAPPGRNAVFDLGQDPSRNGLFLNNSGSSKYNYYVNGAFYNSVSTYTASAYDLVSMRQFGTIGQMLVNGTTEFSGTTIGRTGTTGIYIGDDSTSGDFLQGQIAELIVYDTLLTPDETHDVETYLAGKWGLTISDAAPIISTNGGLNLDDLTSSAVVNLSATDTDNTNALLSYTITTAATNGFLYNSNSALSLELGDSFTQSDLTSGYIVYYHTVANTLSDSFDFTVSDGYKTVSSSYAITVNPVNYAPSIDGATIVSSEDFEGGATGWSDNTTTLDPSGYLTNFLGRHSMEAGAQNTYKAYTLSGAQDYVTVSFDFYRIDSWDTEDFIIYVDDVAVYTRSFTPSYVVPASGSSGNVSWEIQETTPFAYNFVFGSWTDQTFHFDLTIQTTDPTVKIGFSSTLNQGATDEAWGIDNIVVSEVGSGGTPGPFYVSELSVNGTAIGTITATDPDLDPLTYSITGGTGASVFTIDPVTGILTVANAALLDYETTTSYTLDILVQDNGAPALSDTATVTILVLDAPENTAPVVINPGPLSINENLAIGSLVGTVTSTDAEMDNVTYSIIGGNTNSMFSINSSTGNITLLKSPDFETLGSYTLTIRATDDGFGALSGTANVIININDLNEAPFVGDVGAVLASDPLVRFNPATGNFYKWSAAAADYTTATADAQASALMGVAGHLATITSSAENNFLLSLIASNSWIGGTDSVVEGEWRWVGGPEDGDLFWLGGGGGSAQNGYYTSWLAGEPNSSGNEDAVELRTNGFWNDISVANSLRYIIEWEGSSILNQPFSIAENSPLNTSVGIVGGYDADAGDTLSFSIVGGTGASDFAIDSVTGEITLTNPAIANYEVNSNFTLDVRVTDNAGLTDTRTITIQILDVNDTPTDILLDNQYVTENDSAGTLVGLLSSTDEDTADTHTYSFVSNPGNKFSIIGNQLVVSGAIDYEATQTIPLVIRTNDGNGGTFDRLFMIHIGDQMDTYVPEPDGGGTFSNDDTGSSGERTFDRTDGGLSMRTRTILRDTIAGGESGQQDAFYGFGRFFQILRQKTTFQIREWLGGRPDASAVSFFGEGKVDGGDAGAASHTGQPVDFAAHYTNIRTALEQLHQFPDRDDMADHAIGDADEMARDRLAQIYMDGDFVDVMTYHEQKQAALRKVLMR